MTRTAEPAGLRRLGANSVFAAISAASAVLLLVLSALITQVLGEDVFGRFSWALRVAMFGEALMDFGVHQITIRSIARDRTDAPRLFHNSLALKAVSGAAMFALVGIATYAVAADTALWQATLVMLGVAIVRSYLLTIRGVLQGLERFGRDSVVVVGDRALALLCVGLAVHARAGLWGLVVAFLGARLLALGGALLLVRAETAGVHWRFDWPVWRDLQRRALPIGMFLVVLNFYSYIDTLMLGVMSTFVDTGLYSNAYGLYEGLSYIPAILSAVLTPRLANLWAEAPARHRQLARLGVVVAAALAIGVAVPVWLLSRLLLVAVFGLPAADAVDALHVLLLGLAPVFAIWILHAVALSVFKERLLLRTTVVGAIANAGLNLVLIPRYGRNGAALATVCGEGLTLALLLWGLRQTLFGRMERV
jgi:O-antigen/teichoic acid export membrane protein